jgi:hypothetical protein
MWEKESEFGSWLRERKLSN